MTDTIPDLPLLYADAFMMAGDRQQAGAFLENAFRRLTEHPDTTYDEALAVRVDSVQWRYHLDIAYRGVQPGSPLFADLYYRTKMRALQKALESKEGRVTVLYAEILLDQPVEERYLDLYLEMAGYLGFLGKTELAGRWIDKLEKTGLRPRHRERVEQVRLWLEFLQAATGIQNSGVRIQNSTLRILTPEFLSFL